MNTRNIKTDSKENLVGLIQLYLKFVDDFSMELLVALNINNLTEWKERKIPQEGTFNDSKWSYAFHGSGCCIANQKYEVDFEFDMYCEVGGFDVWRLWSFVEDNEELCSAYIDFKDRKYLDQNFRVLIREGIIVNKNAGKESDLYFLN